MTRPAKRIAAIVPAVLIFVYAFLPGDPGGLLPGPPWQGLAGAVLTLLLVGVLLRWNSPMTGRGGSWISAAILMAFLARIILSSALVPEGWSSTFVVVSEGIPMAAERIGRRADDGGVIDRTIALSDRSPALQFLNDGIKTQGGPEATRTVSLEARWRGYVLLEQDTNVLVRTADGAGTRVLLDGKPVDPLPATALSLTSGLHEIIVTYLKPSGEYPRVSVSLQTGSGAGIPVYAVAPAPPQIRGHSWAKRFLLLLDLLVIGFGVAWIWPGMSMLAAAVRRGTGLYGRDPSTIRVLLIAIPLVAFALQGLFAASERSELMVFLIGDDMRQYASDGRNIVLHGLLMNGGRPLFSGEPFFFYPLYPYFIALSHVLFDESFYGLVLLQFVLLGATVAVIVRLTSELFGAGSAWLALAIMVVLGEVNFARYYTVSVFSDNLYYPLVAGAVFAMWRVEASNSWRPAVLAGVLGGLATLTRPSMMLVLPLFVAWLLFRHTSGRAEDRRTAVLLFAASWMAMVGLATLRNWLVSGRFVLLAESSLQILFFLAPPGVKYSAYMPNPRPSVIQTLGGALEMFRDHPMGVVLVQLRKLAFMLGFTNLVPGYRLHPEFVMLSAAYLGWWLKAGRAGVHGAAVHITLLGHVIAFLIASPMTYGYKTMLTLMMLIVPFTAALGSSVLGRLAGSDDGGIPGTRRVHAR